MPSLLLLIFGCQVSGRGTLDGPAVGVAQHENQLSVQGPSAKLKAAQDTAFRMCAGVARVAQNKQIPWQSIEDGLQRHAGISAANQGSVGRLTLQCKGFSHAFVHLGNRSTFHKARISLLEILQSHLCFLGSVGFPLNGGLHYIFRKLSHAQGSQNNPICNPFPPFVRERFMPTKC